MDPHLEEKFSEDLKVVPFMFKFDESTNQQVKKQYDGYFQYWPGKHSCIKISYCGTVMVDHYPAEKLLEHFLEFVEKVELDLCLMLHLSMNGPNVNLKFENLYSPTASVLCSNPWKCQSPPWFQMERSFSWRKIN